MAESSTTRGGRPRRSTRINAELQAARERNAAQQAARKAREKDVDAALKEFFAARNGITKAEQDCADNVAIEERRIDRKAEPHRLRIAELQEQRRDRVAGLEAAQALAAWTIHSAGRKVDEVAVLLQVSQREARGLIAAGRRTASGPDGDGSQSSPSVPVGTPVSGDEGGLGGDDGEQDGANTAVSPAGADSGGQSV